MLFRRNFKDGRQCQQGIVQQNGLSGHHLICCRRASTLNTTVAGVHPGSLNTCGDRK